MLHYSRKKEYKKCKKYIPPLDEWWWLCSQGLDDYRTAFVLGDYDFVDDRGGPVSALLGVRPALSILKSPSLTIGDKFKLVGYTWTIIDETIALCDDHIGMSCFRKDWKVEDANVYEASDVKKYLENWAKEAGIL